MPATLFEKVWTAHTVRRLPNGQTQLFVGLHLIHEVTTPQAFDMLRARGWTVRFPERTVGTVDHIVPTRAPPSIDMLQMVIRSSIDMRSMVSPAYSYAKPTPPFTPSRRMISRMTSFA